MTTNRSFAAVSGFIGLLLWGAVGSPEPVRAAQPDVVVCTQIKTANQLSQIRHNLAGVYCLVADIDLASIANFVPIGNETTPFTGRLYGNGHVIKNLTIDTQADLAGCLGRSAARSRTSRSPM